MVLQKEKKFMTEMLKNKNGKDPNAKLSESGIDQSADFYDGKVGYQSKFCELPQKTFKALMDKDTYDGVKKSCRKIKAIKFVNWQKMLQKTIKQRQNNVRQMAIWTATRKI